MDDDKKSHRKFEGLLRYSGDKQRMNDQLPRYEDVAEIIGLYQRGYDVENIVDWVEVYRLDFGRWRYRETDVPLPKFLSGAVSRSPGLHQASPRGLVLARAGADSL